MRLLGAVLIVGGFLVKFLTPLVTLSWLLMGLGAFVVIVGYLAYRLLSIPVF
jgi:hypothetical protein